MVTDLNNINEFYTMKGYERIQMDELTNAMEDYLEMIYRLLHTEPCVRINELAEKLHVKPSSASKMVQQLQAAGYIDFQKYGYISATEKGTKTGSYLLHRHRVLHDFLCLLNHSDNELEQVEKIEHFINKETICNLELLTRNLTADYS